jgi:EmrB/QacA subfamily drug resistance transporter
VMSVVGVPMLLGPVLGPVLGGLIVDNASWRWIFYVNLPVAALALFLAARLLHADHGRADAGRLDWRGLLLLSPGLAGIVFGLSESESHGGFGAPLVWAPILAGLVLVAAFVVHSLHAPRPLLDLRLFRKPPFAAAAATTFLLGGALFGAMIILPLYYQVDRGETALTAGLLMAPQGLGAALAMPFAGRLTDRVGGGRVAVFGLITLTVATMPFAFVSADTPYWLLAALLVVRGLGLGSTMMPSMAAAYHVLTGPEVPRATSALNVAQRVGGSLGTAVLAVVLQHEIAGTLPRATGGGEGALRRLPEDVRARIAEPLAGAFGRTFWWAVAMSVVALVPALILMRTTRRAPTQPPPPQAPAGEPTAAEAAV